jgi:hypothetical protein
METGNCTAPGIAATLDPRLLNAEAFENYISDFRLRKEQARLVRKHRAHWLSAIQAIDTELSDICEDEENLRQELVDLRMQFERLLNGTDQQPVPVMDQTSEPAIAEEAELVHTGLHEPTESSIEQHCIASEPALDPEVIAWFEGELAKLSADISELQSQNTCPRKGTHEANAYQARVKAAACKLNASYTRACLDGAGATFRKQYRALMDRLEYERAILEDIGDAVPFTANVLGSTEPLFDVDYWDELADWYLRLPDAFSALAFIDDNCTSADNGLLTDIYNALAACQQGMKQLLDEAGGREPLQMMLFKRVRAYANLGPYLTGLDSKLDWEQIKQIADSLAMAVKDAEVNIARNKQELAKKELQAAALADLDKVAAAAAESGAARDADFQKMLFGALDTAIAAGISPTNKQLRAAVIQSGPELLSGYPKYKKHMEAANQEIVRVATLEAADTPDDDEDMEPPTDAETEAMVEQLKLVCAKRKILILGGSANQRIVEELNQTLEGAEVRWLGTVKTSKPAKFENDIKKSHVVLVAKNMSSHAIGTMSKEWVKASGGKFAFITAGYGCKQLVRLLYKTMVPDQASAA